MIYKKGYKKNETFLGLVKAFVAQCIFAMILNFMSRPNIIASQLQPIKKKVEWLLGSLPNRVIRLI